MEFLSEYGLFVAKAVTFVLVIIVAVLLVKSAGAGEPKGKLKVKNLTKKYTGIKNALSEELFNKDQLKAKEKAEKKAAKAEKKAAKAKKTSGDADKRDARVFVLDFKGSIDAKEVAALREEVTAILSVVQEGDEVVLRLETGGGMVHGYGLAASQLQRLRDAGVTLTVCVDKVAASGGYMMACVGNRIISAPFAIVGSIGVVAQLPNFNKLLKKHDIEYEQLTAGEFKRTLTMFGENTDKAREKFKEELEETHILFKDFIRMNRPNLDLARVATGEHWFGSQAKDLGLVDLIQTSDDYLMSACKEKEVLKISYQRPKSLAEKLSHVGASVFDKTLMKLIERGQRPVL